MRGTPVGRRPRARPEGRRRSRRAEPNSQPTARRHGNHDPHDEIGDDENDGGAVGSSETHHAFRAGSRDAHPRRGRRGSGGRPAPDSRRPDSARRDGRPWPGCRSRAARRVSRVAPRATRPDRRLAATGRSAAGRARRPGRTRRLWRRPCRAVGLFRCHEAARADDIEWWLARVGFAIVCRLVYGRASTARRPSPSPALRRTRRS